MRYPTLILLSCDVRKERTVISPTVALNSTSHLHRLELIAALSHPSKRCADTYVIYIGICFFFDRGGNDRYNGMPPLPVSRNTYHLGTSLAIFMDSGSGDDHYLKRQNNTVSVEPGDDIFIDR
jgi:hypothetical protein